MSLIVEVTDLEIRYGLRKAVKGVSFKIGPGESVGLLGANGAGKSSTLKAILGVKELFHGKIKVFSGKPGAIEMLSQTGFAPEEGSPPDFYTGQEYLEFIEKLKTRSGKASQKAEALLSWFELDPQKKIRDYSKGMKRRITLAQAFLGEPKLLILDEPLNGLDPLIIVKLREWLNHRKSPDASLIYSSHILSEVEKVCSRILILKNGELVLDSPLSEIISQYGSVESAFTKVAGQS